RSDPVTAVTPGGPRRDRRVLLLVPVLVLAATGLWLVVGGRLDGPAGGRGAPPSGDAPPDAGPAPPTAPGALPRTVADDPHGDAVSLLYTVSADAGTLEAVAGSAGSYTLTLHRTDPRVVWFSDRPARRAGTMPTSGFV